MDKLLWPATYKCNLSCSYCSVKNSKKEPDISKCIDIIENSQCKWVFITGGEPLLMDGIEDICNRIRSLGKKIGVSTNGTVHNERVPLFVDRLGVSIDGVRNYHNKLRDGSYDKAMEYIKEMVGKVETVLMYTYFPQYGDYREYMENLGEDLGVDIVQNTRGR